MEAKAEEFLKTMLTGYTQNVMQVTDYIANTEQQLEGAKAQKADMEEKVAELEELLGIEEDEQDLEEETNEDED
tara:strand:+ start:5208 stop:5429 length:222 start_codon:yes stop_codon:yes gene_type:complete